SDYANARVMRYPASGGGAKIIPIPSGSKPGGIAIAPDNTVYFVAIKDVYKIEAGGDSATLYAQVTEGTLRRIAIDSIGNLYVTNYSKNRVDRIDTEQNVSTYVQLETSPHGIAIDDGDQMYVADRTGGILEILSDQTVVERVGKNFTDSNGVAQEFGMPHDIELWGGLLYMVDTPEKIIYQIDPEAWSVTKILDTNTVNFDRPFGLKISDDGRFYITDDSSTPGNYGYLNTHIVDRTLESLTLTGTPGDEDIGNHAVVITASDGTDGATLSYTIDVTDVDSDEDGVLNADDEYPDDSTRYLPEDVVTTPGAVNVSGVAQNARLVIGQGTSATFDINTDVAIQEIQVATSDILTLSRDVTVNKMILESGSTLVVESGTSVVDRIDGLGSVTVQGAGSSLTVASVAGSMTIESGAEVTVQSVGGDMILRNSSYSAGYSPGRVVIGVDFVVTENSSVTVDIWGETPSTDYKAILS
ncbi:hypothetical protein N9L24_04570, partial [Candidatus Marinamargulisbacteria bacterium]|nr:hypothetical protein [Candidatus Marinamargulisbacteria bacterium]